MMVRPNRIVSTLPRDTLQVRYLITDVCNFACSYCFSDLKNEHRFPKNVETVIKNFQTMFDMYQQKFNKKNFQVFLSGGGEPTIWPHIERFCEGIKEKHNVILHVITNGSRTLKWWKNNSSFFDSVVLSCHHEFTDLQHHIDVADYLYEQGVKITVVIPMDAKNWDKCISYIETMKSTSKYPWFIEAKAVVTAPGQGMDVYNEEQLSYLNTALKRLPDSDWLLKRMEVFRIFESVSMFDDGSAIPARSYTHIVEGWNQFQGWSCDVALETLLIGPDGTVKGSCQEPIFGDKDINMYSEDFTKTFTDDIRLGSIICPRQCCDCQPETHISKFKI